MSVEQIGTWPEEVLRLFERHSRTRVVFGAGMVARVGALAVELGARRVLLVTDPGIVSAGHAGRVEAALRQSGLFMARFDQVRENPTTACVDACVVVARAAAADFLVGLGGGSALDTAKGCNFILTNGGRMQDYWGVGKASKPMLPLIAIPTTAGTGSECQSAALISDEATHQKMACLDPQAAARVAILDPELTLSQPAKVTALTGIDAIAHAVETAVTSKRNAISAMYSREAFRLLTPGFSGVLRAPGDLAARSRMQVGAALAGLAIEHSMLGAAHAAANPLTARYGLAHGQAVGVMLPWVVRWNAHQESAAAAYAELIAMSGLTDRREGSAGEKLATHLESLLDRAQLKRSLKDLGVVPDALEDLARDAAAQWTGRFNPRPVTAGDFLKLYGAAFSP